MPFPERVFQVIWGLQTPFASEVLCYTPEEVARKKAEIGIVRTACREGCDLMADRPS